MASNLLLRVCCLVVAQPQLGKEKAKKKIKKLQLSHSNRLGCARRHVVHRLDFCAENAENVCNSCKNSRGKLPICSTLLQLTDKLISYRLKSATLAKRLYKAVLTCHCITKNHIFRVSGMLIL